MKKVILLSMVVFQSSVFGAVGCLPGDCCNGRPCGGAPTYPTRPPSRPIPGCPRNVSTFQSIERKVESCHSCQETEVCAEFKNSEEEILGYRCILPIE